MGPQLLISVERLEKHRSVMTPMFLWKNKHDYHIIIIKLGNFSVLLVNLLLHLRSYRKGVKDGNTVKPVLNLIIYYGF